MAPASVADLGDGDNSHLLCLAAADAPVSVAFPAVILTDPNENLHPAIAVRVTRECLVVARPASGLR